MMNKKYFIGVDPGTKKIGIALVDNNKSLVYKTITNLHNFLDILFWIVEEYDVEDIVVGNGINHRKVIGLVNIVKVTMNSKKKKINIHIIDERNSTIDARKIFVQNQKNLISKIICYFKSWFLSLDDYSALVLVHRFLSNNNFKKQIQNL